MNLAHIMQTWSSVYLQLDAGWIDDLGAGDEAVEDHSDLGAVVEDDGVALPGHLQRNKCSE